MKEVEKIILKHYHPKNKKFKTRGWEQCGVEIERFIQTKLDALTQTEKYLRSGYSKQCDLEKDLRNSIESVYESYFKVDTFFAWVDGNEKLKQLISK